MTDTVKRLETHHDLADLARGDWVLDESGRRGFVTDPGEYLWSSHYCECCGPDIVGATVYVLWDGDDTETYICMRDGSIEEGTWPLYRKE